RQRLEGETLAPLLSRGDPSGVRQSMGREQPLLVRRPALAGSRSAHRTRPGDSGHGLTFRPRSRPRNADWLSAIGYRLSGVPNPNPLSTTTLRSLQFVIRNPQSAITAKHAQHNHKVFPCPVVSD